MQQFYADAGAAAGSPRAGRCPPTAMPRGLAVARAPAARSDRRAAARRQARHAGAGAAQRRARVSRASTPNATANYDALESLPGVLQPAGAAAPHRVLRHLDDPGQRDRGVDGGLRGRPHEAARSTGSSRGEDRPLPGVTARGTFEAPGGIRPRPPGSSTTSPRCARSCAGAYRAVLEQGGPFPDLIVIDGGKGQLAAAYAALEEVGLANLVAIGLAKKEELVFTRDRDEPIALARIVRRCGCCSGSATRRTASR